MPAFLPRLHMIQAQFGDLVAAIKELKATETPVEVYYMDGATVHKSLAQVNYSASLQHSALVYDVLIDRNDHNRVKTCIHGTDSFDTLAALKACLTTAANAKLTADQAPVTADQALITRIAALAEPAQPIVPLPQ